MTDKTFHNLITEYRLSIVNGSRAECNDDNTITWLRDVQGTQLQDIKEPALQSTKYMLLTMCNEVISYDSNHYHSIPADSPGLERATYSKIRALAWKTYQQFIRRAYRKGSELRARTLRNE